MTKYSNFVARGRRNALFNGDFRFWPDGTSFTASGHTALMTLHGFSSSGTFTASRSSASKPNDNCNYVHMVTTGTPIASPTTSHHSHTVIRVEGHDFLPFVGKTATLSFWVRASVTGTYSVGFRNSVGDRSYVTEYTINQSNTWEYKTVTLKFDYSGGTWDYTTGIGIQVSFTQMCATTYATSTTDQWITGNYIASTSQVNNAVTTGNTFQISQCQLELGNVATEFEHIDVALASRLAQRYHSYVYNSHKYAVSVFTGTGICYVGIKYPVKMRTNPTITITGAQIWNPAQSWKTATSTNVGSVYIDRCMSILYDSTYASYQVTWGLLVAGTWKFDARL